MTESAHRRVVVVVEQVDRVGVDLATGLADLADQILRRVERTIGGHDDRPSQSQPADHRGSGSTAGPRDDDDRLVQAHALTAVIPRVDSMTSPSLRRSAS